MADSMEFASELIAQSASGYGAAAAHLLLERSPKTAERFGDAALRRWTQHLSRRLQELAAAMAVAEPAVFAQEVNWSRAAFDAREVPTDDLRASIECLWETLEEELPESVKKLPGPFFDAALVSLAESSPADGPLFEGDDGSNRLALQYVEELLAGHRRGAIDLVLSAVENGLSTPEAHTNILMPAQRIVGDLWHAHQLSMVQEHFVTAATEDVMTLLANRSEPRESNGLTVVVAPVVGNTHRLGARASADWLDMAGWRVVYLGSDLPAGEVATAVDVFEADLLALSVALVTQLRDARKTVQLTRDAKPDVKILLGGRIIDRIPGLWQRLGGDAAAGSPAETVEAAARLFES